VGSLTYGKAPMNKAFELLQDRNIQVALFLGSGALLLITKLGWITWPSPWVMPVLWVCVVIFGLLTLIQVLLNALPRK
jgi:hypothetical protein